MKSADIVPNEQVSVYNIMNGARFETYAIEGTDGQICLNGAAARLAQVGDLVIIVTFADLEDGELAVTSPTSWSSTRTTGRSSDQVRLGAPFPPLDAPGYTSLPGRDQWPGRPS